MNNLGENQFETENLELFEENLKFKDINLTLKKITSHFSENLGYRQKLKNENKFFMQIFLPLNIFFKSFGLEINRIELKEYIPVNNQINNDLKKKNFIKKNFDNEPNEGVIGQEARDRGNMSEKCYIQSFNE